VNQARSQGAWRGARDGAVREDRDPAERVRRLLLAGLLAIAAGCTSGPTVDHSRTAASQGSRVQFVILHFTWGDWETSLATLTEGPVSSHYLVRDDPVRIYQLVDESRRAFHAGASSWRGHTQLNAASIGIEIVNAGNRLADQGIAWQAYPDPQVEAVVALVKDIVTRHGVRPENVLGHSDIAPLRKLDPGPRFPWRRLAEAGLVPWPEAAQVVERRAWYDTALPPIDWFQRKLAVHGFAIEENGVLDDDTRKILAAFQMKYRPERFDGEPDAETAAILDVLTATAPH
jgi:N-acetylmuramoyl-L-alanine amidase